METRRFVLALAMSLLVFLVYVRFFAPAPPEQPVQEPVPEAPQKEAPAAVPPIPESALMTFRPPTNGKDIIVETGLVKAVINTAGGVITSWELKHYQEVDRSPAGIAALYQRLTGQRQKAKPRGNVQLVPAYEGILMRDRVYPLEITPNERSLAPLSHGLYRASHQKIVLDESKPQETLVLTYRGPAGILIEKRLTFYHDSYMVDMAIQTKRLQGYSLNLGTDFGIADKVSRDAKGRVGLVALLDGNKKRVKIEKIKGETQHAGTIDWFGQEDKYFTATILYGKPGIITSRTVSAPEEVGDFLNTDLTVKDAPKSHAYKLYAGPKNFSLLQSYGRGLEQMVNFGWFGVLGKPMFWLMRQFYSVTKNYGIAIILLTIVVRVLLFYPSLKSAKAMEEMKAIQPEMTALREKHKKDPQRMNQEIMKLYKERKVNPLGGCLPMLLQLPFFIALYNVLSVSIELRQAVFIPYWIDDLSLYDPFYVLPVLMGLSMILTMKLTATTADPKQAKMFMFMNIAFIFLFARLPSGLLLYITLSNVLSIAQQLYVKKLIAPVAK